MKTHIGFLTKAKEMKLRLEAEGMHSTAEALDQIINTYIKDHSDELLLQKEPNVPKAYLWLTRH
ncbi:hypothetical protein [Ruegeria atlantica]|uniref:hypothetical protein n=1 Tax=Ruegeria atlantica TaxID=81569 RepID=UPI001480C353|nr:hypothetical protein [Ruegeria atlantica]